MFAMIPARWEVFPMACMGRWTYGAGMASLQSTSEIRMRSTSATAWSRRQLFARARQMVKGVGGRAVTGGLALASTGCTDLSLPSMQATRSTLKIAAPVGGPFADINETVLKAFDRVVPVINAEAGRRFTFELMEVPQPATPPDRAAPAQVQVLAPLLSAGTPPDLLVLTQNTNAGVVPAQFAQAASNKWLRPLDDHLAADKTLALKDFVPAALDACRDQGKLLGLPLMAAPLLLTYDAARFERAGLARPPRGWAWPQLMEAARKLTRDTDGDGAVDEYGFWSGFANAMLLALIWQNGGELISPDKATARLMEPAAGEAIEFYADFYRYRLSPPREPEGRRPPVGANGIHYLGR